MNPARYIVAAVLLSGAGGYFPGGMATAAPAAPPATQFHKEIQPILTEYCGDCHMEGVKKGGISFDDFTSDEQILTNRDLWTHVLKNVRGNIMPPPKRSRPKPEDVGRLVKWIKTGAFGIDTNRIDPGKVTVRRLNRVEYRNTIRDLLGVDFNTDAEFPPDDTGYGFDDIGDVLNLSPMLLEKYLNAARIIVGQTVPVVSKVMPENIIAGRRFYGTNSDGKSDGDLVLSYYENAHLTNQFQTEHAGNYQVTLDFSAHEKFVDEQFDANKCRLTFKLDGQELKRDDYGREGGQLFHYEFNEKLATGPHVLELEVEPLTHEEHARSLTLHIKAVTIRGPSDERYWIAPKDYARYFPRGVPTEATARRAYAKELLRTFATKAFRRPVDEDTLNRLTDLAGKESALPGKTFEAGVAHAMVAVLVSPRFLFHQEAAQKLAANGETAFIDDYSLASRLSYFLWSTMPDEELTRLAGERTLRFHLDEQIKRMLTDSRSEALARNFTGQWLQARDTETVAIDSRAIMMAQQKRDPEQEANRARFRELAALDKQTPEQKKEFESLRRKVFSRFGRGNVNFDGELRSSMRRETELYFSNIVHEDRSVLEFLDSDYTFLNARLARHYGLTNLDVTGTEMRKVQLPPDSARGGVITMGTVLTVTSNPTRTSPVKRGLFILDNILGDSVPPPPPNIPALEDSEKEMEGHEVTLREVLALHREKPLCSSCHKRMDPMGLALENFNAMGMWRSLDHGLPIDCAGTLNTGETFTNIQQLKKILVQNHRMDFYRTLTEKLLTYALGRGLEYYDTETVDEIVDKLDKENGRMSVLLNGVIKSVPFQKCRIPAMVEETPTQPVREAALKQTHEN